MRANKADDDALMDRFERNARRFGARDAIVATLVALLVLALVKGPGMVRAGERVSGGVERAVIVAVGKPTSWVSDRLPLHKSADKLTAALSPDAQLADAGGFDGGAPSSAPASSQVPPVTPDAFAPAAIGGKPPPKLPLRRLLVTGDSLSTPLDLEVARRLAPRKVDVRREPHLGSGISKTLLVDWGKLSVSQARDERPDAVVVFIGANEGFPMPGPGGRQVQCCGVDWAAVYANRVRQMMSTYRRGGAARVYWITVPTPRDPKRLSLERAVNAAIGVAAQPWRAQVDVIDTIPIFTPGDRYRDAMPVDGVDTLVRESDGIHLNQRGAAILADVVVGRLKDDFTF